MSERHTQGEMVFEDKRPSCNGFSLFVGDQYVAFIGDSDSVTDAMANSERMAACWNACQGIDTADLMAGSTESKVNTTTATPTPEALAAAAAELERQHAENQSLTTENKRLREAILRLRHWNMGGCYHGNVVFDLQQWIDNGMAGELPEYPAHLPPSQQQKTALKPLCRDCADFGPICPTTGLPCDGSGEKP